MKSSNGMGGARSIIGAYRDAFEKYGRSSAAVLCPKGRHTQRFDALIGNIQLSGAKLLDVGCGLGHLCTYLDERGIECDYVGIDIVPDFIVSNQSAYPSRQFKLINEISDIKGKFDFVLASGVFNLRYFDDPNENWTYVQEQIKQLFKLCGQALSIDFMTSLVDFSREDALHVDPADILGFALRELSRRVVVNHSYLPYEFSVTVFKTCEIDQITGLYR